MERVPPEVEAFADRSAKSFEEWAEVPTFYVCVDSEGNTHTIEQQFVPLRRQVGQLATEPEAARPSLS